MDFQKYFQKIIDVRDRWQNRPQSDLTPFWIAILLLVIVGNAFLVYFNFFYSPSAEVAPNPETEIELPDEKSVSLLTGLEIDNTKVKQRPVAVMLDNYPGARPQSGIAKADMVWELYVEGGVTRLLAIFQSADSATIGPVRSAREYYIPLVKALDAVYVHSGGSPAALEELAKNVVADADEFKYADAFYRSRLRLAPHNLFTNMQLLAELIDEKNWQSWNFTSSFIFNEVAPDGDEAEEINVRFSSPEYNVRWSYDPETKKYRRFVDGELNYDAESEDIIAFKNIIILFTEVRPAPRANYPDAVDVVAIGSGDALFVRDGVAVEGAWRISKTGQVEFTQINGAPYELAPGTTWVAMLSADIPGNISIR